jgi:hypothetical protein
VQLFVPASPEKKKSSKSPSNSVNDYIDEQHTAVHHSSFDNAVSIAKKLGKGALIGKKDIKSVFRLLPCYPGDFVILDFLFLMLI